MNSINLSRRELMMTGGGIVITKLGLTSRLVGEDTQPAAKDLIFRTTEPRNGEPSLSQLVQSWITPVKHFYVRSHAPNPVVDINQFVLTVEGKVRKPLALSLEQLNRLARRTVTATLTCAGNRRTEFNQEGKVGGVQWEAGAIGNAQWSGFALADVLKMAEVLEGAKHVWVEGLDKIQRDEKVIPFGASIPIEKAMQGGDFPGALLVDRMNGQALTPDHGYPLRTVVPGYIGARSVKWLGKIVVSDMPSPNHYLAHAYKIVKSTDPLDWTEAGPIYRYPINGAIASPAPAETIRPGWVNVSGYVLPTGHAESKTRQVEIST
ncbi:MAG: molybdopterin-dependent oxidoreductase, partial [Pirellulaceae bacterium]|nr:molybdopterin-dependent oxidoreductase [Pirellulaceae bacterium]